MDLFTYMDAEIYQMAVTHTKENPLKHYMEYLADLHELTAAEESFSRGIGREFIHLIETTSMSKVYKMPVLYAFYNDGNIRMEVTEAQLLESWKKFFGTGTNWKDLPGIKTYSDYKAVSDREHVQKILGMPVHFLLQSGKGFFVEKDGFALALRAELQGVITDPCFAREMGDVIEYRAMDYYQRRYEGQQ